MPEEEEEEEGGAQVGEILLGLLLMDLRLGGVWKLLLLPAVLLLGPLPLPSSLTLASGKRDRHLWSLASGKREPQELWSGQKKAAP